SGFYSSSDPVSHVLHGLQYHVRIMFLERHEQFWKDIWRDRGNCAHCHLAGNFALELIHATPRIADRSQDLSRVLEQTTSGFGDNDRTRQTVEPRLAHLH